jgi:CRP/FNR family transcriptional regulator, cyclic AMP receptor protein
MQTAEIESIPLFASLSPFDRARVAAVTRVLQLGVGHVVVNEGEFAFDFYAIKHGAAEVKRGGERVAELGPGDVFGEMGVVFSRASPGKRRRTATVVVTAPTEAIAITGGDFRRLTEDIPALRDAILATIAGRADTEAL